MQKKNNYKFKYRILSIRSLKILYGYYNPIEIKQIDFFCAKCVPNLNIFNGKISTKKPYMQKMAYLLAVDIAP